jgi:hypothetical protein
MFNSLQHKKLKEYFGDEPFLVHHTHFINEIIKTKYIIPSIETDNNIYGYNLNYVYFSISNSSLIHYISENSIILRSDFLLNEPFSINIEWMSDPQNNEIKLKNKPALNNILNKYLEIYHTKQHRKRNHLSDNEVLIKNKVSIDNVIGIVLSHDKTLENINQKIQKCQFNIKKYKDDKEKIKKNEIFITSLRKSYKYNLELIEYCNNHNIAIIYIVRKSI